MDISEELRDHFLQQFLEVCTDDEVTDSMVCHCGRVYIRKGFKGEVKSQNVTVMAEPFSSCSISARKRWATCCICWHDEAVDYTLKVYGVLHLFALRVSGSNPEDQDEQSHLT